MYTPVIKNRTIEMKVLKDLYDMPLSEKTVPLVEIVQEKTRSNSKTNFIDDLTEIFSPLERKRNFLVDIIKTNIPKNTLTPIRDFLTKVNRKKDYSLELLKKFNHLQNVIPVISYNPQIFVDNNIIEEERELREYYDRLAFRINSNTFDDAFELVKNIIQKNDILIYDIGNASHMNPILRANYLTIASLKTQKEFTSILLNSNKSNEITNVSLSDGKPILEIDNSIRDLYKSYHKFDGFADYAGMKDEMPTKGGGISPAGIYYSFNSNYFVGFRRNKKLSDFEDYIAPQIIASKYWSEYNASHHKTCPGCNMIFNIAHKKEPGKSQAKWKGITMYHYIFTLDELL
ncbi:MAG: hypothetical protein FH761_09020 [Firmicutes bacterium]|nr:hypothetical protein [Bacillota bacterium]